MTRDEWDSLDFESTDDRSDFVAWLRLKGCSWDEYDVSTILRYIDEWSKSRRKGKHNAVLDSRRRKLLGPGKYWASTSSGVFLNKRFVKGWRGINPDNP